MRKIYIHIGAHKTGTTALQNFLTLNREILHRKNYVYPGKGGNHYFFYQDLYEAVKNKKVLSANSASLLKEISDTDKDVILSTEGFTEYHETASKLKNVLQNINDSQFKIIFYVRRQDHWLESAYKQQITQPSVRSTFSFDYFINQMHAEQWGDYYSKIKPFREAFGIENITLRVYEKHQIFNNIFADFLMQLNLDLSNDFIIPAAGETNISPSPQFVELLRICNELEIPEEVYRLLLDVIKHRLPGEYEKKEYLFEFNDRIKLLESYALMNSKMAKEFLLREDGILFYEPMPVKQEYNQFTKLDINVIKDVVNQFIDKLSVKK